MYDISGHVSIENNITKPVLRERLVEMLQLLNAEAMASEADGSVEFRPAPRNRGKHPLKNISTGRIEFVADDARTYIRQISFQLSLIQMRISLVTISIAIWVYSLFIRGYPIIIPLAFTILTWIFGYVITLMSIRTRFRTFLRSADY